MAGKIVRKEDPAIAARHCLTEIPYRMIVYVRTNQKTPLYCVAGSEMGPSGAKKALSEAFRVHGGDCFYCKKPVQADDLSVDHAEPLTVGGKNEIQNLLIAHKACNIAKGRQPIECYRPDAGREWLGALLAQVQDRLNRL